MAVQKEVNNRPPIEIETTLYKDIKETQWPIIYSPEYNISFLGLEKLHPFDAGKWGRVYEFLKEKGMIRDDTTVRADEAQTSDLLNVHSESYINSLKLADFVEGINNIKEWSVNVAGITEVPPVALLPNFIVQRKVLKPFRFQTGGTILAAKLALERGWGINIGGGFHHCSAHRGGGFCAYADITLAIRFLMSKRPQITKVMIVDLDAHQGNGHERDFMEDKANVYIMDVYNREIYPHDGFAKRAIRRKVELNSYVETEDYLRIVETNLEGALNEFDTQFIVYNAGTDILENDPLGCLSISPQGIIDRDEIVFRKAHSRKIPIMMVTSGGYQKSTAQIIADSIDNLKTKGFIECEAAETAPLPPELMQVAKPQTSRNEGGMWAKFCKNCSNLSRSSTSENVAAASALSRSRPSLHTDVSPNLKSKSSGLGQGMARSKTQEDMKKYVDMEDDEFFEETLDFKSMLEAAQVSRSRLSSDADDNKEQASGGLCAKSQVPKILVSENPPVQYDSSPYDSDNDVVEEEDNNLEEIQYPSYDEFIKEKTENVDSETPDAVFVSAGDGDKSSVDDASNKKEDKILV